MKVGYNADPRDSKYVQQNRNEFYTIFCTPYATWSLACPLARLVHKYTGLDIKSEMHAFMSIPSKQQKIWRDIHMCCDQSGSFNAMLHRHLGRSVYTLRVIIDRCPFAVIQGHLMASATIEMWVFPPAPSYSPYRCFNWYLRYIPNVDVSRPGPWPKDHHGI